MLYCPSFNKEENMFAVIFGRSNCSSSTLAKEQADNLKTKCDDFNYRFIDIHAEGISKADLEKIVGKPVTDLPQIFIDEKYIGGYEGFEMYAKKYLD